MRTVRWRAYGLRQSVEDLFGHIGIHLGANAARFNALVRLQRAKSGILQRLQNGSVAFLFGGHHFSDRGEGEHLVDEVGQGERAADRKQFHSTIKKIPHGNITMCLFLVVGRR